MSGEKKEEIKKAEDYLDIGKLYFLNQRYEEALSAFQKVIELEPGNPQGYYNLGLVYESKNMMLEAKKMFTQTLELDSKFKPAEDHLAKLVGI
ncbi:MAG: tetratricopeptide repeat protein [Candidatus Ratteibacteria bacterium]|nr:tetratricopeptide repeat protein [Candidatus Ratteibacteria bacterium]